MRWSTPVENAVGQYVKAHFGQQPFAAVHWRRGYLGQLIENRSIEQLSASLSNTTDALRSMLPPGSSELNVYLASNQLDEADRARVLELANVDGLKLHSLMLEPSLNAGMGVEELSRIEQGICTRASVFDGTSTSQQSTRSAPCFLRCSPRRRPIASLSPT